MISFHFKKVLLDEEIIPSPKNLDWVRGVLNQVRNISDESAVEFDVNGDQNQLDQTALGLENSVRSLHASRKKFRRTFIMEN